MEILRSVTTTIHRATMAPAPVLPDIKSAAALVKVSRSKLFSHGNVTVK